MLLTRNCWCTYKLPTIMQLHLLRLWGVAPPLAGDCIIIDNVLVTTVN